MYKKVLHIPDGGLQQCVTVENQKYEMLYNLKFFEHQCDTTNGKLWTSCDGSQSEFRCTKNVTENHL
jgi:hypothetical protein